jgi:hypothetical protein
MVWNEMTGNREVSRNLAERALLSNSHSGEAISTTMGNSSVLSSIELKSLEALVFRSRDDASLMACSPCD